MTQAKEQALLLLRQKVLLCRKCDRVIPPPVPGEGPFWAKVVFLGRNPGYIEHEVGRPFVGDAGMVLDGELVRIGVDRPKIRIDNLAKCYTRKDRPPTQLEYKFCYPHLIELMDLLKPKLVFVMGKEAYEFLEPGKDWREKAGKLSVYKFGKVKVALMPIIHPAAVVHKRGKNVKILYDHFNSVRRAVMRIPEVYWKLGL